MDKKEIMVRVRYTQEQKEVHQKKANLGGLSLSEYLRQAGDNAEIFIKDSRIDLRVISEPNRFGNNLNQLAKSANKANLTGKISDDLYLQILQNIKQFSDEVRALTQIVKLQGDM